MKCAKVIVVVLVAMALVMAGTPAMAYDLPAVNLGFTSFMDGGPPAGPGFYFTQYVQFWSSDELTNADGGRLLPPTADEELGAWISLTQFIYQSDTPVLFGGKWGLDVIVPMVEPGLTHSLGGPPENKDFGMGDILIGPYLQWDPIMGPNGPRFMHRIELQMIFPTGDYDKNYELNPGSNFFSFNPYWAGTLFLSPRFTISARLHYLWNDTNSDPNRGYVAAGANETQAGQAVHMNFATAYEVMPQRLRIGLNGYYLRQLTETEMNGQDVSGTREKVFAIGPGAVYHMSKDMHLFCNLYFESMAENRPEGKRLNLRFVYHF